MAATKRIFLSCASKDFGELRGYLARYLRRADHLAQHQEEFRGTPGETLGKLDNYIRNCDAVIHLVGGEPGALPTAQEQRLRLDAYRQEGRGFLDNMPVDLQSAIGEAFDLTYTSWEPFMALHHNKPLLVYCTSEGAELQATHLARLQLAHPPRYATQFEDTADLLGLLIGDLGALLPELMPEQELEELCPDLETPEEAAAFQSFYAKAGGKPVRIEIGGIVFRLIPPGRIGETTSNRKPFYLAEMPLTSSQWEQLATEEVTAHAEKELRLHRVLTWCANAPFPLRLPTLGEWQFAAAAGGNSPNRAAAEENAESTLGLRSMLWSVRQPCTTEDYCVLCGGASDSSHLLGMAQEPQEVLNPRTTDPRMGLRPAMDWDLVSSREEDL